MDLGSWLARAIITRKRWQTLDRVGVGFDTETHLRQVGLAAPPLVCGSTAVYRDGQFITAILDKEATLLEFVRILENPELVMVTANGPYDLLVCATEWSRRGRDVFPLIWRALEEGRIYDVLIGEALGAIARGHRGRDPRTGDTLRSEGNKPTKYYSLWNVTGLRTGRWDAKVNDKFRMSYALLENILITLWPPAAQQYPQDDARNTLEDALCQCGLLPSCRRHRWGEDASCVHCGVQASADAGTDCWHLDPAENLHAMAYEVEVAFALHVGASWGNRVDQEAVLAEVERVVDERAAVAPQLSNLGFLRRNPKGGLSEHKAVIATAVARAAGAAGACLACGGIGRIVNQAKKMPTRRAWDPQKDGRACLECHSTGLDLGTAPDLRRTAPSKTYPDGQICANADVLAESASDDLRLLGDYKSDQKVVTSYGPFLSGCGDLPLTHWPNVLIDSDRVSYAGLSQTFPRDGALRACVVARTGMSLCSVDYNQGEVITHAQSLLWLVGKSRQAEMVLAGKEIHLAFAAAIMNISYDEAKQRKKVGDKSVKDRRQAAKCFHPDTEVLVRSRGWLRIGEVTIEDEVAAAIPGKSGIEIRWEKPYAVHDDVATKLVHLKNMGVDVRVTRDHQMLTRGTTGVWKAVRPERFGETRSWYNAGSCLDGAWAPDERLLRLAVAAQADGSFSFSRIRFGFVKQHKVERLRSLLREGEFREGSHLQRDTSGPVTTFVLSVELSNKIKELLDRHKQFTWHWLELTPSLREVVLTEIQYWDGWTDQKRTLFSSTQKQNIDIIQALASISNRKSRATNEGKQEEHHNDCWWLSIASKPDSRGGNVEMTVEPYNGPVKCISVPSDYILVRDGGVPLVAGQCWIFGRPGAMGVVKLVMTQRIQGPDTPCAKGPIWIQDPDFPDDKTKKVRGYRGLRFCILMDGRDHCGGEGEEMARVWGKGEYEKDIPPTCRACLECASRMNADYMEQFPETRDYFEFVEMVRDHGQPLHPWQCEVLGIPEGSYTEPGQQCQHVSCILRGGVTYNDCANGYFQSLLAVAAKRAMAIAQRECTDRTLRLDWGEFAGGKSPLLGSRCVTFAHDEIIAELLDAKRDPAARRLSEILVRTLQECCPDLAAACKAPPAMAKRWYKGAEPVCSCGDPDCKSLLLSPRVSGHELVPWQPKPKKELVA